MAPSTGIPTSATDTCHGPWHRLTTAAAITAPAASDHLILPAPGVLNTVSLFFFCHSQQPIRAPGDDPIDLSRGVDVSFVGGRGSLECCEPASGFYSHSIVAGGFPEMSYTTREMPSTSFTMRRETWARNS